MVVLWMLSSKRSVNLNFHSLTKERSGVARIFHVLIITN